MIARTLTFVMTLALLGLAAPAGAQTGPTIVVMGEDADADSVPRGNRIFERVLPALAEEMNVRGFDVYDETAVAMGFTDAGRVGRTDAELIEVARAVGNPPLDVMVIFSIYASAQDSVYSDLVRPSVRIPGRLLNVATGQQIGSFEVTGLELPPLPVLCDRECLLETVGDSARLLAADLAVALTDKLEGFAAAPAAPAAPVGVVTGAAPVVIAPAAPGDECAGLPTAFVVRVEGFEELEVSAMEEYLAAFGCAQGVRPVRAAARSAEYWYETRADSGRLNRNLRLMLEHMDVGGQVSFAGNTFVVTKVATR